MSDFHTSAVEHEFPWGIDANDAFDESSIKPKRCRISFGAHLLSIGPGSAGSGKLTGGFHCLQRTSRRDAARQRPPMRRGSPHRTPNSGTPDVHVERQRRRARQRQSVSLSVLARMDTPYFFTASVGYHSDAHVELKDGARPLGTLRRRRDRCRTAEVKPQQFSIVRMAFPASARRYTRMLGERHSVGRRRQRSPAQLATSVQQPDRLAQDRGFAAFPARYRDPLRWSPPRPEIDQGRLRPESFRFDPLHSGQPSNSSQRDQLRTESCQSPSEPS